MRIVVAGGGVLGAAVARHAALAGHDVVLVEPEAPGHPRGASGDETRIIRCAHGDDRWHTRSARRAWALWHEIDPGLVDGRGVAWLARRDDGYEAASQRVLEAEGIPCERVDPGLVAAGPYAWALWEPEAGVVRARQAVGVLTAQAVAAGARVVSATAGPDEDRVVVGGEVLEADRVVWACGAWLPRLFPGLVDVRVTQQDVFWFAGDDPTPAWCDFEGAAYGVGSVDGAGMKVCPDAAGPPMDPSDEAPAPDEAARSRAVALLAARFPRHAGAPVQRRRTCHYELTADTRPILAPHPDHPSVWLMGGTSGHGFKHAPAWAELMVDRWLTGAEPADPAFGLGPREPAVSLRTSG